MFEASRTAGVVKDVEADLAIIVNQISLDPEFKRFMIAPYSSRDEKAAILGKIFDGRTSPLTMQLLRVMLDKGRENEITGVYEEFVILRRVFDQIAHVVVSSAQPLDATQQKLIVSKLGSVLNKQIEPEFESDPALIGGIRVKYENFVMDGSVRGALGRLKEKLRHDVMKQP
jgi:F-type H+-transporting ATPase subunit delta